MSNVQRLVRKSITVASAREQAIKAIERKIGIEVVRTEIGMATIVAASRHPSGVWMFKATSETRGTKICGVAAPLQAFTPMKEGSRVRVTLAVWGDSSFYEVQ